MPRPAHEVLLTEETITVRYADGAEWVWKRRENDSPEHPTCAPMTCSAHIGRFNHAWLQMVGVKKADEARTPKGPDTCPP